MPIPAFLRRLLLLRRARRHLEKGEIEASLVTLSDPRLALAAHARVLREAALEQAERSASRAAASGDAALLRRWALIVAAEDPTRAASLEARFAAPESGLVATSPLARLLAEMRAAQASSTPASTSSAPASTSGAPAGTTASTTASAFWRARQRAPARLEPALPVQRFHLAVDDGGELLVACGTSLVLGHLRSPRADLPFLAGVEAEHARIVRDDSFHAGASWRIEPLGSARVVLNGRALGRETETLCDGDEVELASNLAFRFRTPEAASASALLELHAGAECEGVRRILLLASGESGRVRIGSKQGRHVHVADLAHEIALVLRGSDLLVRCAGGVGPFENGRPAESAAEIAIACPPRHLVQLRVGARATSAPPFSLTLRPSEPPPRTARETGSA